MEVLTNKGEKIAPGDVKQGKMAAPASETLKKCCFYDCGISSGIMEGRGVRLKEGKSVKQCLEWIGAVVSGGPRMRCLHMLHSKA